MLVQPSFPNVTPLPQYSQVITISPNLGAIGAPQLGHLSDATPEGAMIGPEEDVLAELEGLIVVFFPHFVQNFVSSGS
jgi:hypothetical protein